MARIYREGDGWEPSRIWLEGGPGLRRYLARIDGQAVATADSNALGDDAVFLGGAVTAPRASAAGAPTGRWSPPAGAMPWPRGGRC